MLTFSIITVNFNSGEKLAITAASVLEQQADAEHLIIDGASTDRSIELARELACNHPASVKVISEPDRGIYDAMNKGIHTAGGRYLYFLGAGDRMLPGALAAVGHSLPAHDRAFVYGDIMTPWGRTSGRYNWRRLCKRNLCHQAIFYGREVFKICGMYDLQYRNYADWDLNLRCFGCRRIERIYVPALIAEYEGGGISEGGDSAFERDKLSLIRRHLGVRRYLRSRLGRAVGTIMPWAISGDGSTE